ncbi:MAG TPA: tetratricopeptide repeat protein [Candidatus Melainabacteria bacterium]|nr:tetratricopeptide repeat protein [Candidatus Melainabacteria bacterium]
MNHNRSIFRAARVALLLASSIGIVLGSGVLTSAPAEAKRTVLRGGVFVYTGDPRTDDMLNHRKYADVEERCLEQLRRNPGSVPAMIGAGWAQGKLFKLDAANANFDKALAKNPSNPMAHAGKAMVLFNRLQSSSQTIIKQKDALLKQAEAEARQSINYDSRFPEAHWTLGMILREQGRYDEAIKAFRDATNMDSNYSDGYSGLAQAQLDKGDIAGAIQSAKEAVAINSGNSTAHYALGEAYRRQGLLDEALKELNTALYQYRNSAPVHLSMGKTLAAQGNTVGAVKEFQESIRIKAENPDAYLGIADIREARGDIEHSIAELRSGLEMMPNNAALRERVADQLLRVEKLDDAIKEYTTVMDQNPNNAVAAKGLTRAYYLKANKEATGAFFVSNEYESAKRMLDQAVRLNPNDMELRLAQAKLRSLSGETVDLNSIGAPTNDGERIAYAEALLAQNKFKESDEQMNRVISNAADAKQTFAVADLALMIKDLPSAEAAYRKASAFPGGAERAKRGMDLIAKQKEVARQDLTLADDLAKRQQVKSAIDKYRSACYQNPKVSDARLGYAICLEKDRPETADGMRLSATQFKAYMALEPALPEKEVAKLNKKIASLEEKAYKLDQKSGDTRRGTRRRF